MIHTTLLLAAFAATLYLIRRDLTGFNHEAHAGKWAVDGRKALLELLQAKVTLYRLRRDLRANYRAARAATVRELEVGE